MDMGLSGRVVIVTGGASGIGDATVSLLLSQRAIPVVLDLNPPDPETSAVTTDQVTATQYVQLDLTDDAACASAVEAVLKRHGKIDALVNNAGVNDAIGLSADPSAFRRSLDRNLVHYFTMTQLCAPHLRQHSGAIVNISSKVALTGQGGTSAYAAAKGGVLGLTREWAAELARYGVRVNAVVPGETLTPMYKDWLAGFDDPDQKLDRIVNSIPLSNRMTKPEEIAGAIVFLLSDWAGHMTGQSLVVDGGYSDLDRALTHP